MPAVRASSAGCMNERLVPGTARPARNGADWRKAAEASVPVVFQTLSRPFQGVVEQYGHQLTAAVRKLEQQRAVAGPTRPRMMALVVASNKPFASRGASPTSAFTASWGSFASTAIMARMVISSAERKTPKLRPSRARRSLATMLKWVTSARAADGTQRELAVKTAAARSAHIRSALVFRPGAIRGPGRPFALKPGVAITGAE